MKAKKSQIAIFSSAAGFFGMFGHTAYATSKTGLIGFAESLRYELKPLGRAQKDLVGRLLMPEAAARSFLKAIAREKSFHVPGAGTGLSYLLHRLSNGGITRALSDMVIAKTRQTIPDKTRGEGPLPLSQAD